MRVFSLIQRVGRFASVSKFANAVAFQIQQPRLIHSQTLHNGGVVLAGHSHWQNIKNTKEAKDKQRGTMISQYIGKIRKCIVASNNPDPKSNSELAKLVEEARGRSVPKASIDRALKNSLRAAGSKPVMLEARGPGGVALIIEGQTDKLARLRSELGWILKKNGGQFADGIKHHFVEKGVIDSPLPEGVSEEKVEDFAIEAEAEEFDIDDSQTPPQIRFFCDAAEVYKVANALKASGFTEAEAQVEFLPQLGRPVDPASAEKLDKLLGLLEEHVEVLRVFNNASLAEE